MSSTDMDEDDPSFLALPARLRHRIDSAFNSTASSVGEPNASAAGGFILEESEAGPSRSAVYEQAGGFIVDPPSSTFDARSYVPLSDIPRALRLLDLSPDDDIIRVFENAATGWGAQHTRNDGVSRKDWRAVCAALLEGENGEESPVADEDVEMGADSGLDSDEYQTEQPSSDVEASSDEYAEPSRTGARAKKAQKVTPKNPTENSGTAQLSESQKAQCRQDFSRFFPDVPDNELDSRRIMIQDIVRVAGWLKENLKTEEILDMLGAFSSSPDKSMNLVDFERMMAHTKLV